MKSLYDFIVEPLGDKYNNEIQVGGKKLVVNTKIESWTFVNRLAKVIETPIAFKTKNPWIVSFHESNCNKLYHKL